MEGLVLTIRPEELSASIFGERGWESSLQAAEAVAKHLAEKQPQLAALVSVRACQDHIIVTACGARQLDTLRAVEGVLGVEDRLPERDVPDELPEIEVDEEEFSVSAAELPEHPEGGEEILRSRVRYFPLPTCEWFEIREGELTLWPDRIVFEGRYQIVGDSGVDSGGLISIPLRDVTRFERDVWLNVPCLTVETEQMAYRFGWPASRDVPERLFYVEEWLDALRRILGRGE